MRALFVVASLITVAGSGCPKDSTAPVEPITPNGQWMATVSGSFAKGGSAVMVMSLRLSGDTVTGTGVINDQTDPPVANTTVTGAFDGTNVQLTIQVQPQLYLGDTVDVSVAPASFSGTVTGYTMNGTLTIGEAGKQVAVSANFNRIVPR